jgi:hypothetical protein
MKTRILYCAALLLFTGHTPAAETRDLILVAGQSNAVGYDAYASELPPDAADQEWMFWWRVGDPPPDEFDVTSGGKWSTLQPQPRGTPLDEKVLPEGDPRAKLARQYGNFKKPEGGFGPEIGLARELRAKEGKSPAIVKVAFSGTGMATDWNPEDAGPAGACYRALVEETKAALAAASAKGITLRPRALVWVQGESDANPKAAAEYEKNLGHMLERLRADLGAPEMIALIGVNVRFGNGNNPNMPTVVAQQKALAEHDRRCVYVDTEGAETLPPHTHFTAAGTLEVGRRFAAALLKVAK